MGGRGEVVHTIAYGINSLSVNSYTGNAVVVPLHRGRYAVKKLHRHLA